jgi:hypothetical protein
MHSSINTKLNLPIQQGIYFPCYFKSSIKAGGHPAAFVPQCQLGLHDLKIFLWQCLYNTHLDQKVPPGYKIIKKGVREAVQAASH